MTLVPNSLLNSFSIDRRPQLIKARTPFRTLEKGFKLSFRKSLKSENREKSVLDILAFGLDALDDLAVSNTEAVVETVLWSRPCRSKNTWRPSEGG